MEFDNKVYFGYIYATRFIASWLRSGGSLCKGKDYDNFRDWLCSLGLTEEDAWEISFLASNGKLELETNAKKYLKNI